MVRLSSTTSFGIYLFRSLSVSSAGISPRLRSRSSASDFWLEMLNAAGQNEEANGFIHYFPEGLHGLFNSSCFASFSIACPVRFLEVDVGSPRHINQGQFGVDGNEDGQMIAGQ